MFFSFMDELRSAGISVSLKEHLLLLEALHHQVIDQSPEEFYYLSRATLVKDEGLLDRFDQVFAKVFKGLDTTFQGNDSATIPEDWLKAVAEKFLSEEEMEKIKSLGSWEEIMETLKKRLEEQKERHQGGSKWIGTGGTSPFGAYGENPAGIRIGQDKSRNRSAVKVWDERQFRDYDDNVDFNTRNIKVALRRLRRFAREGAVDELDLPHTLEETGKNAGMLSIQMRPERRNAVKVLLLLDIGGSMDDHVEQVEALFSAAKTEFKRLEHFYFHNCLYDFVWKTNRRRTTERTLTMDLLHKYGPDYRVIFVGDAAMSPYEIEMEGGSVEYTNSETGKAWLQRVTNHFKRVAWLNPMPPRSWEYTYSTDIIKKIMNERMYPTTVQGLTDAMKALAK